MAKVEMEVIVDCDADDAGDAGDVNEMEETAPATFEPQASDDIPDEFELPAYGGPPMVGTADWHYYHPLRPECVEALLRSTEVFATRVVDDVLTPGHGITHQSFSPRLQRYVVHTCDPLNMVQWGPVLRIISILETDAKGKHSQRYIEGRLLYCNNQECHIFSEQGVNRALHEAAVNIGATRMELNV
ncbi:hypothetical protein FRC11_015089, partial [Ceratobasidium sp. 423]